MASGTHACPVEVVQTASLTSTGLFTLESGFLRKYGKVVELYVSTGSTIVTVATGYQQIATIPEGFRPLSIRIVDCIIYAGGGQNITRCVMSVTSDGEVNIAVPSAGSYAYIRGHITYVI